MAAGSADSIARQRSGVASPDPALDPLRWILFVESTLERARSILFSKLADPLGLGAARDSQRLLNHPGCHRRYSPALLAHEKEQDNPERSAECGVRSAEYGNQQSHLIHALRR